MNRFAKLFAVALIVCAIFVGGVIYERYFGPGGTASSANVAAINAAPPNLENNDAHVFLLAGQSNMDGRGELFS
ncbi:MAG: hypothetical protein OSB26_14745 [Woeseiaceae bacterium]|jgi:hypothetical protein|nr:hypothetical protein [Woeseiaceae bacterium]|tara:strand:+ start:208 stop:429 length:222 start_codon:yes stop_codon:yes gene_type:complete